MELNESPKLLTTKEAAEIMRVSPDTVRRLVANGSIPGTRVGTGKKRSCVMVWSDGLYRYLHRPVFFDSPPAPVQVFGGAIEQYARSKAKKVSTQNKRAPADKKPSM